MSTISNRLQPPYSDTVGKISPIQQAASLLWNMFRDEPFSNNHAEDSRTASSAIMLHMLGILNSVGMINGAGYHSSSITMLRAMEDALDCFAAVAASEVMAIKWYSGELKASEAAKYWTEGKTIDESTPLGEYRKLIRNGLNHYSHCTPEQTKWNLYRHQVSDNTFVLKLNFNKAIITINAYYIDRYLCVHLCDIIDIVLSSFSDFLSKDVDAQKTLVTLREACEKIVTDFLKDIDDDKVYMDTPPEIKGIKPYKLLDERIY